MAEEIKQIKTKSVLKYIYKDIILAGCGIFTFITLVFMLMLNSIYENPAIPSKNVFLMLAFSMTFSLANQIFRLKSINIFLKAVIHFVLSSSIIAFFFLVLNNSLVDVKSRAAMMILIIYVAAYLLVLPFYIFLKISSDRKRQEQQEYKSIYKR